MPKEKSPRYFLRDDSGEPAMYCGDNDLDVKTSICHYLDAVVLELLRHPMREDGAIETLTIERRMMTDSEIANLPNI